MENLATLKPRKTDISFTSLLLASIAYYAGSYLFDMPESGGSVEDSMRMAAYLAVFSLLNLIRCAAELVLLYCTWGNVLLLPRAEGETGWQPSPAVAALPMLIPFFSTLWAFVAYGRLPRLVELRTGRPFMPSLLVPAYLCCKVAVTLLSTVLPWLSVGEILPEPSRMVGILLTGLDIFTLVLFLLVAWYMTVFNRQVVKDAPPAGQE